MRTEPWGYHYIADVSGCNANISEHEAIKAFSRELVEAIDMKAYGEPIAEHFASHDPIKGGYTLVQLIETSNICAHFVDATGEAYFDVFSCKPFDPLTVNMMIEKHFAPSYWRVSLIERGGPFA